MPLKLDQRIVKSLQPGDGGRVRVADSVVQGLHIELGLPGKDEVVQKTWRLRYRTTAGDRKWFTIGSWPTISVDKARAEARKLLGAIEGGDDPSSERNKLRQAPTVSVMWEQFLELHGRHLRPTTLKGYQDQYRAHIEPVFGSVRVQDLEREAIARWHHKKSLKAPTSADYSLRVFASLLARCEEWGYIPHGSNPARHIKQNPHRVKHRPLTVDELHQVGATINEMQSDGKMPATAAAILRLLLLTGCRRAEIVTLKWADIDMDEACIVFKDHKTAKRMGAKKVFLGPAGMEIIKGMAGLQIGPYVFPSREGQGHLSPQIANAWWNRVRTEVKIPDARIHDLRHTLGAKAGAILPAFMVQTLLGHSQPSTTSRYATPLDVAVRDKAHELQDDIAKALGL